MKWPRACCCRNTWRASIIDRSTPRAGGDNGALPGGFPAHPAPGFLHRIFRWALLHKVKTLCILVGAGLCAECATLPLLSVASLKTENPGTTALMQQRIGEAASEGRPLKIVQKWIPLSALPRYVSDAVVVEEDGNFYSHGGVDWFEVQESIEKDIRKGRAARGGSTITQQVAKNLYLSTSKDPVRKLKELLIALLLEHELGKNRILEIYMNIIEWGRGIFGIQAASRAYFGKSASALTLDEALRLAAVIPSPLRHRPDSDSRFVMRRRTIVRERMAARDMVPGEVRGPVQGDTLSLVPLPDSLLQPGTPAVDTSDADDEGAHGL